jgi:transposase
MMGISKCGIQHLRTLLVHGARAVVRPAVRKLMQECGSMNFACGAATYRVTMAVANKNARVIRAVLVRGKPYRAAA